MKKKILLSVFAVFSLMMASKSFAQYHTNYIKVDAHVGFGNGYGNGGYRYDDRYSHQDRDQMNKLYYDQQKLSQVQRQIAEKNRQLQEDRAYGRWREFEEDQRDLKRLYEDANYYQTRINSARQRLFYDNRVSSYRRF